MYSNGLLFSVHDDDLREAAGAPATSSGRRAGHELLLARRHALPSLHPLDESGLGVADGPPDPDVGRPVAAHARLGQPGQAELQKPSGILGSEQDRESGRRFFGRPIVLRGQIRSHRKKPFVWEQKSRLSEGTLKSRNDVGWTSPGRTGHAVKTAARRKPLQNGD